MLSRHPPSYKRSAAFRRYDYCLNNGVTLVELLVIVIVIGVLSSLAVTSLDSFRRRERANAVALAIYGWLNEVRQASLRLNEVDNASDYGESCTVSFRSGVRSPGDEIASVSELDTPALSNSDCRQILGDSKRALVLNDDLVDGKAVEVAITSPTVTFTPRGLTTDSQDVVVGWVVDSRSPRRCIRISAVSGFLQIGRSDQSSTAGTNCSFSVVRGF